MFWWRASLLLALATPVMAGPVTLPARAVNYRPENRAWAGVEATAPLVLRAATAARIVRVRVTPGQAVAAGQVLATLGGPQLDGELAAARAQLRAAQQAAASARRSVESVRRTYPLTSNREALEAAQAAASAAQSRWAAARASLAMLEAQRRLSSPAAATVGSIAAAPGTDVQAGAPVLTLLPHGRLWLRAEWFGATRPAAPVGRFMPSDGGPPIAVRLVAELPARAGNGARVLNFAPVAAAGWQAGETGEVSWPGAAQAAVAVPASSLILDAGKWYVLTDAGGQLAAQAVTPGPSQGNDVVVMAGLQPGVPVVVRDAYLLYHRHFAAQYTPPD
ncbi:MAG: biotin/lipoyl-binding protein [Xanthomonadaceae bacterium]|nr:biotin/lipoyl-binding protein [Xanthomonadaceae bacterium]